jgi:MazG family protein
MDLDQAAKAFREFTAVIKALRTPGTGCPWDLEQTHHTLRPYLLEEAYEVLDALERGEDTSFRDELGDLLLQVVLHAQVADDRGAFSITEVLRGITEKMVRRHPHVFGDQRVSGSAEVVRNWETIKAAERQQADGAAGAGVARIPEALPALLRAHRVGSRAAAAHADAGSLGEVLATVQAAMAEVEEEVRVAGDGVTETAATPAQVARQVPAEIRARLEKQIGQVLFNISQLARWLGLSAEDCLRDCTRRFVEELGVRQG